MKALLSGLALTAVIGGISVVALSEFQKRAYVSFSSDTGARVGDPGHNLVGPNWNEPEIAGSRDLGT